eukprot:c8220_g1_i1 orf=298-882(-)
MGGCASKKVEEKLKESALFQVAVDTSFEECLAMSQHTAAGVFLYQLLDASCRIYFLIPLSADQAPQQDAEGDDEEEEDPAPLLKQKWLSSPPSQSDVDQALRHSGLAPTGTQYLTLEEFREFASCLFRDMVVASAEHRLALYVPVGSITVLVAHLLAGRLPIVGPAYRSAGLFTPGLLLGSVLGAVSALGFRFP